MARRSNPARRVRSTTADRECRRCACLGLDGRTHGQLVLVLRRIGARPAGFAIARWGRRAANRCRPRRSTGHLRARRPPTAARNVAHPGPGADGDAGRRVLRLARTARVSFRLDESGDPEPTRAEGSRPRQPADRSPLLLFAIDGARARREVDVDPLMDADACGGSPCQLACRALHHAEKMVIWRTGTKVSALRFVVFTTVLGADDDGCESVFRGSYGHSNMNGSLLNACFIISPDHRMFLFCVLEKITLSRDI